MGQFTQQELVERASVGDVRHTAERQVFVTVHGTWKCYCHQQVFRNPCHTSKLLVVMQFGNQTSDLLSRIIFDFRRQDELVQPGSLSKFQRISVYYG